MGCSFSCTRSISHATPKTSVLAVRSRTTILAKPRHRSRDGLRPRLRSCRHHPSYGPINQGPQVQETITINLKSCFGCHSTPFTREICVNQLHEISFFWEARDNIVRAVEKRMSAALIAAAGSGKSTVVRAVIARLPQARSVTHYVKCTDIGKRDMCREIACVCGVPSAGFFPALLRRIQDKFESSLTDAGRRPVLLLDEAQDLRPDVLSMLRVLTNFQMDSKLVLSVVLAGQPPLAKLLAQDDQSAVARRIVHYATLRPLSRDETAKYVEFRMGVAGARQSPFDDASLDAIYEIAQGNLRITDNLALESLELAAAAKLKVVSAQHVAAARRAQWPS
ncbi:MAG: AAA family ATPase [Polyangiaceae bacterium]|nr:AAA family ATPase [Polyangiaceae bacterium]